MSLRQSAVVFTATHRPLNGINAINLIVMDGAREKDSLITSFSFQIYQYIKSVSFVFSWLIDAKCTNCAILYIFMMKDVNST